MAVDITRDIQRALKRAGFYKGAVDGEPGPKTRLATMDWLESVGSRAGAVDPKPLARSGVPLPHPAKGWGHIEAYVEGDDIIIVNAKVTAFGGAHDKMDSGQTASGLVNTAANPDFIGCALPMRRDTSKATDSKGRAPILRGSPIPKLPWLTKVVFTDPKTGTTVTTQLIDEGPAGWTKHAGDLTVAAARKFDPNATANAARIPRLTIRILGGAKFVS